LLGFTLGQKEPGDELKVPAAQNAVMFKARMRSIVPIDHLQVVCNGKVLRDLKLSADRQSSDVSNTISLNTSGWCLLRAFSDKSEYPILDLYPYATTSPIYVNVTGSKTTSPEDAAYFVAWIDRVIEATKTNQDWNTDAEKSSVLDLLNRARAIYSNLSR
jgi:hypothetical protein